MGYMAHHAIVVTSYDRARLNEARAVALDTFPAVTEIVASPINGFASFLIPPDGSKACWQEDKDGDVRRSAFIQWLNSQAYDDGSSAFDWVEVQYGDDDWEARVTRSGDEHTYRTMIKIGECERQPDLDALYSEERSE